MKIEVTLNGEKAHGRPGMTILELARERGVDIPTLCHHPDLTPAGVCRLCVVEVEGWKTLAPSCQTPIADGMVIHTHSDRVAATRRTLVELMLASHPDVCIICDKGNRCELRRVAADLGIGLPRFRMKRHYHPAEDAAGLIVRDPSKCILCRRCIRACREIKGADVLAMGYRGFDCKVIAGADQPLDADICRSCDVCLSVCPVGALQRREEAAHGGDGSWRRPRQGEARLRPGPDPAGRGPGWGLA